MDLTISRPIKIFVLVAVIAGVGGAAMLMMKPKPAAAPPVVANPIPAAPTKTTPTRRPSPNTTAKARAATQYGTPAAKPVKHAKKTPAAVAANGLPTTIEEAFRHHRIVVVSVFDPQSATDAISYAEAKAGASEAGAGFVGVSLLDNRVAAALTSALPGGGLLPAPGVLLYRRPGTLVGRLDGFTDRDVVAQAAASSVTAAPLTSSGA